MEFQKSLTRIIDFLKNKNKAEKDTEKKMKEFDIIKISQDEDGRTMQTPESGVKAMSPQELINLYAACGEKIRILRMRDIANPVQTPLPPMPPKNGSSAAAKKIPEITVTQAKPAEFIKPSQADQSYASPAPQLPPRPSRKEEAIEEKIPEKPKFFKISGIDCKLDNGKLYQKQWMSVGANEISSIRILSRKSNKIIPLDDKVIEVLKWVEVKDND